MNITKKELGAWLSNNWRPTVTQEASRTTTIRCTAIDVISREYADDVQRELKNMLGEDDFDLAKNVVFEQRTAAAKRVLENMTPAEREKIHDKVKHYKEVGLPSDIQRM